MANDSIPGQVIDDDDTPMDLVTAPRFIRGQQISTSYLYEALNMYSIAPYDPSDPFESFIARTNALNTVKIQYINNQLNNVFDMIGQLQTMTYQNSANIEKLFSQTESLRNAYNMAAVAFNNSQIKTTAPLWQRILQFQASVTQSIGASLGLVVPEIGAAMSILSAFESALLSSYDHRLPEKTLSILDKTFQYISDYKIEKPTDARIAIAKFQSYYTMLELRQAGSEFFVCIWDTKKKICLHVLKKQPYLSLANEDEIGPSNLILSRKLPYLLTTLMQRVANLSKFNVITSSILRYVWTMIRIGLKSDAKIDG